MQSDWRIREALHVHLLRDWQTHLMKVNPLRKRVTELAPTQSRQLYVPVKRTDVLWLLDELNEALGIIGYAAQTLDLHPDKVDEIKKYLASESLRIKERIL